jgi:hypothetical protein
MLAPLAPIVHAAPAEYRGAYGVATRWLRHPGHHHRDEPGGQDEGAGEVWADPRGGTSRSWHFKIASHVYLPETARNDARHRVGAGTVRPAPRRYPAPHGTVPRHDLGISRSQVRILPGAPGQRLDHFLSSEARCFWFHGDLGHRLGDGPAVRSRRYRAALSASACTRASKSAPHCSRSRATCRRYAGSRARVCGSARRTSGSSWRRTASCSPARPITEPG